MTMDNKQPENINNTVPDQQPSPDQSAAVVAQCGGKLHCYDWLSDIPESHDDTEMVEVQFKNTRKGYYKNSVHLRLEKAMSWLWKEIPGMTSESFRLPVVWYCCR